MNYGKEPSGYRFRLMSSEEIHDKSVQYFGVESIGLLEDILRTELDAESAAFALVILDVEVSVLRLPPLGRRRRHLFQS